MCRTNREPYHFLPLMMILGKTENLPGFGKNMPEKKSSPPLFLVEKKIFAPLIFLKKSLRPPFLVAPTEATAAAAGGTSEIKGWMFS